MLPEARSIPIRYRRAFAAGRYDRMVARWILALCLALALLEPDGAVAGNDDLGCRVPAGVSPALVVPPGCHRRLTVRGLVPASHQEERLAGLQFVAATGGMGPCGDFGGRSCSTYSIAGR